MRKSENFDLYLPSRDDDDIVDINQISENFSKLDVGVVKKEEGKQLSDENYTLEEKIKLRNIEENAQKNAPIDENYSPMSKNAQSGIAVSQALELCASAIVKTVNGTAVALTDVSPFEHILGVRARSKNLIPTAYPAGRTITSNGVTYTFNDDLSITANGIATAVSVLDLWSGFSLPKGKYILSGCPKGGSLTSYALIAQNSSGTLGDVGEGKIISLAETTPFLRIRIRFEKGYEVNNMTFYPQLEEGTKATPYTLHIPNFLFIEKYYKTDDFVYSSDGDKTETPTKNVFFIVDLDKFIAKSIEQGRTYQSGNERFSIRWTTDGLFYIDGWSGESDALLNEWGISSYGFDEDSQYIVFEVVNRDYSNAKVVSLTDDDTPVEIATYPINADGTVEGVTSLYPTTTLIPDMEGIFLEAEYIADTKKYIDNKFAEMQALMLEV